MAFRRLAIEVFITAAISVGLGLLGPFGTFALPLGERLLLWVGVVLAGYVIYRPVQTVAHWLAEETAIPRWTALLIAGALAALPLSFVVGFAFSGMRYDPVLFGPGFPQLYLQVFGITALIQIVMHFLFPLLSPEDEVAEPMPQPRKPLTIEEVALPDRPTAPFFERLPKDIGDHLVCLEMQDHYVKAHTLSGSAMVLIRMRDAIAELGGIEGLQVHRSWWIARSEVRAIRREGRNIKLELANGILAPVSRNRQGDLKRDGWL